MPESSDNPDPLADLTGEDGRIAVWEIPNLATRIDGRDLAFRIIEEQVRLFRQAGDTLGAGEWSAAKLMYAGGAMADRILAEVVGN